MRIETIFENFELLTDTPNAVAKLRGIILQLAVHGKLVPQDQNDESASSLLMKIQLERQQLIERKQIRNLKPLAPVDNFIFVIPEKWKWERLGNLVAAYQTDIVDGPFGSNLKVDEYVENGATILRLQNVDRNRFIEKNIKYINLEKAKELSRHSYRKGDILITKLGDPAGKACIVPDYLDDGVIVADIIRLRLNSNLISREYITYTVNSNTVVTQFLEQATGITRQRVNLSKVRDLLIPVPPLAEQKRIVEKCDHLLSLCDQIEVRQQKRQKSIVRTNESAITQLLSAQNPDEFRQHWQCICNNFDLLYSIPETIPKLRQAILQLAVQGKLVHQDPNDEPALVLVERMIAERDRLIAKKKINNYKPQPFVEEEGMPFKLPQGWRCVRLGEIMDIVSGVTKGRNLTGRKTALYPYLRVANVQRGFLVLEVMKEIEIPTEELEKYKLQVGDILLTEGGDWDKLGRSAVWQGQIQEALYGFQGSGVSVAGRGYNTYSD